MSLLFTHTFELKFEKLDLHGEVEFNKDGVTTFKPSVPFEWTLETSEKINKYFKFMAGLEQSFGKINKIEIVKK